MRKIKPLANWGWIQQDLFHVIVMRMLHVTSYNHLPQPCHDKLKKIYSILNLKKKMNGLD